MFQGLTNFAFIDLEDIKGVYTKLETLYGQYKTSVSNGETTDKFFKGVKKLKRGSIIMNIGTSMVVLGILTPAIMVAKRLADKEDIEFHTKKQIREKMREEGLIA